MALGGPETGKPSCHS